MRRPNSTKRTKMDRKAAADVLAEGRAKRSDKEQLAILDQRLGGESERSANVSACSVESRVRVHIQAQGGMAL